MLQDPQELEPAPFFHGGPAPCSLKAFPKGLGLLPLELLGSFPSLRHGAPVIHESRDQRRLPYFLL